MSEAAESATDGQALGSALPPAADASTNEAQAENSNSHADTNGKVSEYQGPVDLSGLDENLRIPIENRIKHITKLMGKQERGFKSQLQERDQLLAEQSRIIQELQSGVTAVVDHLSDRSLSDAEAQAKQQLREAHQSGDTEAFITANDRLAEIKAKKALMAQQKKAEKPKETRQPQQRQYAAATDFVDEGIADGDITNDDGRAIGAWQNETDESGMPVRPWAKSRNPANPTADPIYRRALVEAAAVFDEASPWADKSVAEKLAELDRRMGVVKPQSSQNVMGGKLTLPNKTQKIGLTPYQEQLAVKMQFAGKDSKLKPADHIEAYRKQVQDYKAKKGSR